MSGKLAAVLAKHNGNITQAAKSCGLLRDAFRRRLMAEERGESDKFIKPQKAPVGLRTEGIGEIIERETLDPIAKVIEVCKGMPDGQLAKSDDMRQFLEMSKSAWGAVEMDAQLTSFRCVVPKKGSATSHLVYFGNDAQIAAMKRKKGVR